MHVMADCDGVVYDFSASFNEWAGYPNYKSQVWSFYKDWGWTTEQFLEELSRFGADGGFADRLPMDGTQAAIYRLLEAGHRVTFVTDVPETAESDRAWWIDFYFPGTELIVSKDKTVFIDDDSEEHWGIDDKVENVEDLLKAEVQAFAIDRPWNRHASHLPRVHSLDEFVNLVLEL